MPFCRVAPGIASIRRWSDCLQSWSGSRQTKERHCEDDKWRSYCFELNDRLHDMILFLFAVGFWFDDCGSERSKEPGGERSSARVRSGWRRVLQGSRLLVENKRPSTAVGESIYPCAIRNWTAGISGAGHNIQHRDSFYGLFTMKSADGSVMPTCALTFWICAA